MAVISGTQGNDDGTAAPVLQSPGEASTLYGLAGNDVLISASRPFDTTPDVLYGGIGDDRYEISALGRFPIYSTPIQWVYYKGDVDIHESIRAEDKLDTVDLTDAGYDFQNSATFDGADVIIQTFGRAVRLHDNYAVDAAGNLLAGVDKAVMLATGGVAQTFDLKLQSSEFDFIRNGTASANTLAGTEAGNVIDGRGGNDVLKGLGGNDFLAGGVGNDKIVGGDGNDRGFGGDGADSLDGGAGDDLLSGMRGNDLLTGGAGSDKYNFAGLGDGRDVITDTGGANDAIVFGEGITLANLLIVRSGADVTISLVGAATDSLRIVGQTGAGRIERLLFADGSSFALGAANNAAPEAADDAFAVVAGRTVAGNLLADNGAGADRDPDGEPLSVVATSFVTAHGGVVTISADGAFTYAAAAGFVGADGFAYTVADGFGATDSGQVAVTVGANRAPILQADQFSAREDVAFSGNLFADNGAGADRDPDGDTLAARAGTFTTAAGGRVTVLANGNFTYTPATNSHGEDSFTYVVDDGFGLSASAVARLHVAPVNDAPIAATDIVSGSTLQVITGNVLGNDRDVDGDHLAAMPAHLVTSAGGVIDIAADGSFSYVSDEGRIGSDNFKYTVNDGNGGQAQGTVLVNLLAPAGARVGTAGDDVLVGTAGADTILTSFGNDEASGGLGDDRIYGAAGEDRLNGDGGNDQLFGGTEADRLFGGSGNDRLMGGAGVDQLRGDAGADTFLFASVADGIDVIADYRLGERDVLDLSRLFGTAFDPAANGIEAFVRITEAAGRSTLAVDLDGSGAAYGFVDIATLTGVTGLTNEQGLLDGGFLIV